MSLTHEPAGPKILEKSKSISSAEPNYLCQFEMRYPVGFKYILSFTKYVQLITVSNQNLNLTWVMSMEQYFAFLVLRKASKFSVNILKS